MSTASCHIIKTNSPIHGIGPPTEPPASPSKPEVSGARVAKEVNFRGQTVRIYFQQETFMYCAIAKCGHAYVRFQASSRAALAAEIKASIACGGWPSDRRRA